MQSRGTSVVLSAALAEVVHTIGIDERDAEAESMPDISLVFKPFVLVRTSLDRSTCTNGGEVMGVSNHGEDPKAIAVGYFVDDDEVQQPFVLAASTNTVTMLDMDGGAYESGRAMSISPDGLTIAGHVYHTSSSGTIAVVWEAPNYKVDATLTPSTDSYRRAVADDDVPAGAYDVSGRSESVLGDGGPGFPFSGSEGEAAGINSSEFVSGWHRYSSGNSHACRRKSGGASKAMAACTRRRAPRRGTSASGCGVKWPSAPGAGHWAPGGGDKAAVAQGRAATS